MSIGNSDHLNDVKITSWLQPINVGLQVENDEPINNQVLERSSLLNPSLKSLRFSYNMSIHFNSISTLTTSVSCACCIYYGEEDPQSGIHIIYGVARYRACIGFIPIWDTMIGSNNIYSN